MNYEVPKIWSGQTCVILAGGPSLKGQDLSALANTHPWPKVIAINDSWKLKPYASALYFSDAAWWQRRAVGGVERVGERHFKHGRDLAGV